MAPVDIAALSKSWIAYWLATEDSPERESLFWVSEREWELVQNEPMVAWQLVLTILSEDCSDEIQEVLAAGPLEDLLAKHGPILIETVERQAGIDTQFARLLGGVWRNSMTDEVWSRVQKVWDRRGWDGNAQA